MEFLVQPPALTSVVGGNLVVQDLVDASVGSSTCGICPTGEGTKPGRGSCILEVLCKVCAHVEAPDPVVLGNILEGRSADLIKSCRGITLCSFFCICSSFCILTHIKVCTCAETVSNVLVKILLGRTLVTVQLFDSEIKVVGDDLIDIAEGCTGIVSEVLNVRRADRN